MNSRIVVLTIMLAVVGCTKEPDKASGEIVILNSFASKIIPNRQVEIYLPRNYDTTASYPVIYMHDGQNVFNANTSSYGISWEVDEKMDSMTHANQINPAIVVAIWNHPLRWNEYLPEPCFNEHVDSTWNFPELRQQVIDTMTYSNKYITFIVKELKPYVDDHFATNPAASHAFLMGSSMGGLISFYGNILYPNTFGGAACISTHWTALNGECLRYFKGNIPDVGQGKRFYFDHGNRGLDTAYNSWQPLMDKALKRSGYRKGDQWATAYFPGADHNEHSWNHRVQIPLQFLLGKPQ